jgi:acyl carrier protein
MELTAQQIRKEFLAIIAKLAGKKAVDLKDGDRFREDLGFDSLKSLEAISRISEIYDFIPDLDEIMDIQNIGDVIKYLEKKLLI